ncbi:DoxX family protein [Chryseobacterium sp. D764]|uniref:DoxX family protein n=1 Tax=unclassified Chryseobacterium TaxID=2593645 RepID=UPI0015D935E5|nr:MULTISPECIES: DoxX family protein [unclassified Chryseobacterium]QXU50184.1 DoxX family protein [Chryseobacterium sp. D764]
MKKSVFLRLGLSVILLMHSVISIFSGDVNNFGHFYLDSIGFSPIGIYIAWAVKLTHLFSVPLLWFDRYIKPVAIGNILIFVFGIYFVHWQNGWFVVGGGTNGIEFNVLLIFSFLSLMYPEIYFKKQNRFPHEKDI